MYLLTSQRPSESIISGAAVLRYEGSEVKKYLSEYKNQLKKNGSDLVFIKNLGELFPDFLSLQGVKLYDLIDFQNCYGQQKLIPPTWMHVIYVQQEGNTYVFTVYKNRQYLKNSHTLKLSQAEPVL